MDSRTSKGHERPTLSVRIDSGPASPLSSGAPTKVWSPATSGQTTPRQDLLRIRAEMELIRNTSRYDGRLAGSSDDEADSLAWSTASPSCPPVKSLPQKRITRTPSPVRDPSFVGGSMIEYSSTWLKEHPELTTPVLKRPWPQDVSEAGEELAWQLDPDVRLMIEDEFRRHRRAREDGQKGGREDFLQRFHARQATRAIEGEALPPPNEAPKPTRFQTLLSILPWTGSGAEAPPKDKRPAAWKRAIVRKIIAHNRAKYSP